MCAEQEEQSGAAPWGSASAVPRLVVGDDGSPAADVVWLWVNNHRWPGWRISVVTARPPKIGAPVGPERAHLHPWEPPNPRLLLAEEVEVEHLIAETDPRLALDSCDDAALVAVGPRGHGLFQQLHVGSTTRWLIGAHRPLAPVAVVRSAKTTRNVLLCTDGSDHAKAALETLLALPWLASCSVAVLGVDNERNQTAAAVEQAVTQLRRHGVEQVTHEVIAALAHTAEFDTRSAILTTIADLSPDLVAVGARGTGGIRGLLVGSVTAAVVQHAPCSVLVAKSG